ncbi:hypothetical protein BXZ70DRAFT_949587 [Cristinia sonorae]|uniref:Uncharacterized protein n=1 Tax=Cristinia sonorae TaxID=1940300 RepID=A0A8K0XMI7_9AGAR|nr:hypothetical protein BXZ70DRAFT_949587 [Cristinia sonorae]
MLPVKTRLNWDVIVAILPLTIDENDREWLHRRSRVKRGTLLAFMKTCRSLYRAGMPLFLTGRLTIPDDISDVLSFCGLILGDPTHNWAGCVQTLSFGSLDWKPPGCKSPERKVLRDKLTATFRLLRNLTQLDFSNAESFCSLDLGHDSPIFCDAVADVASLTGIKWKEMGPEATRLVGELRAHLTDITICYAEGYQSPTEEITILDHHSPYLEQLTLSDYPAFRRGLTFPRLHTFNHQHSYFYPYTHTSGQLVDAFPVLKRLILQRDAVENDFPDFDFDETLQLREQNRSLLLARSHLHPPLEYLQTSVIKAYTFAFNFEIRSFAIDGLIKTDRTLDRLRVVIPDIRPTYLDISLSLSDLPVSTLDSLFVDGSIPQLTHLRIYLKWAEPKCQLMDIQSLGTSLISCFKKAPSLTTIAIEFNYTIGFSTDPEIMLQYAQTETALRTLHTEEYIRRIAQSVPDVSSVSTCIARSVPGPAYWRIKRTKTRDPSRMDAQFEREPGVSDDSDVGVEAIDEALGRKIMEIQGRHGWGWADVLNLEED